LLEASFSYGLPACGLALGEPPLENNQKKSTCRAGFVMSSGLPIKGQVTGLKKNLNKDQRRYNT
jgi:hypothetical protein